ncbi:MAG: PAS domain S-box protein [Candidatus Latescibacteria bacterium]|nr:PAS domain S-box protein [Candidatus Latescibacterota bacterium]
MDGSDELERSEAAQRQASDELRQRVEERAADLRSVDESLQREAAQRQRSEERFRNIFEYSNDAILVLDPDHDEILDANPRACRLLSYTREELGNLTLGALFPEDLARLQSFALAVVADGFGWMDEISCQTLVSVASVNEVEVVRSTSAKPANSRRPLYTVACAIRSMAAVA